MGIKKVIAIFTKVPVAGLAKTRLASALNPEWAAALYRSFLLDTVDLATKVSGSRVMVVYTPRKEGQIIRDIIKKRVKFMAQNSGNLGSRISSAFKHLFMQGYESAIIIGADSPTLPLSRLKAAFAALEKVPLVLGPSLDGGYYLIGLNSQQEELFKGIAWGTNQVLSQTIDRANQLGLHFQCLETWYDIDTVDDLKILVSHLGLLIASGRNDLPRSTVNTLHQLELLARN